VSTALPARRAADPGHTAWLEWLGLEPLLDLGMRLGEASGALAAVPLLRLGGARAPAGGPPHEGGPGGGSRPRGRHVRRVGPGAMKGLLGAVSFLTRVPAGGGIRRAEELAGAVPWFPVVGGGVRLA